jgi:hypothetical protein
MLAAGNVALAVYAVSDLLVVAMIVSDLVTRRRVHASLVWGGSRSSLRSICRRWPATPMRDVRPWPGYRADGRARNRLCSPTTAIARSDASGRLLKSRRARVQHAVGRGFEACLGFA